MYNLEFSYIREYKPLDIGFPDVPSKPLVQVILRRNRIKTRPLFAVVDSGADQCIFSYLVGVFLGIDVFSGEKLTLSSLGAISPIEGYLHDVEMEVVTFEEEGEVLWRFQTQVAFATTDIPRNILGREGFFKHALVGFVEMEQKVYLSPYK